MTVLRIRHETLFCFESGVSLNPHRLFLRPREGCDLRLLSHDLQITPSCEITWAQDVFGNAVAVANFTAMTDNLVLESFAEVELTSSAWPVFPIAASAISYRFKEAR